MKENSIEEDIELLQDETSSLGLFFKCKGSEKYKIALEHILSDYKRVLKINEVLLKENEELKLKEKRRIIGKYGDVEIHDVINRTLSNDYIPIQKVKDKIKKEIKYHEKNILDIDNITMLKGKTAKEEAEIEFNKYAIVVLKKMLQELLEGCLRYQGFKEEKKED